MDKIIVEDRRYHTALRMGCAVYESILISLTVTWSHMRRNSLKDFQDQLKTSRWACLWEIVLVANGYRKVWPTMDALFPGQMVLDCRRKRAKDEGVSLVDTERRHTTDGLQRQYGDLLRIVPGNSQERNMAGEGVSSMG